MAGLLGSFNPDHKQQEVQKYQKKYGKDNIHLITRSKLFLTMKILIPLTFYIIIYIGIIVAIWYVYDGDPTTIAYSAIIGLLFVCVLFMIVHLKRLIDYLMDFIVVTPSKVISFNQKGIRKRSNMTIEANKIKSISIMYRNRLFSIFNNGDIKFLSEGDANNGWEIQAFYVSNPQKTKDIIYKIINTYDPYMNQPHSSHASDIT